MFADPRFIDQKAIYPLIEKLINVIENLQNMHYGEITGGINKDASDSVTNALNELREIQNLARLGSWSIRN